MLAEHVTIRLLRLPHGDGIDPPQYMTEGAAAADVRAAVDTDVVIEPGTIVMIPTGFAIEIPPGWVLSIRPRSGLAVKHGVTVVNAPATIDEDYRGEVKVGLVNIGREPFTIARGMRIAQVLLERVTRIKWEEAETLAPTARGAGGFGHSGV